MASRLPAAKTAKTTDHGRGKQRLRHAQTWHPEHPHAGQPVRDAVRFRAPAKERGKRVRVRKKRADEEHVDTERKSGFASTPSIRYQSSPRTDWQLCLCGLEFAKLTLSTGQDRIREQRVPAVLRDKRQERVDGHEGMPALRDQVHAFETQAQLQVMRQVLLREVL